MLNRASKITTLIVFLSFLASSIAFSQDYDDRGGPRKRHKRHQKRGMHFGNPDKLKEILNLNDEQINKIKTINSEYKGKFEYLREKIKPEKKKLRNLLKKENINLRQVKSQLEKIAMLKAEIRFTRIKHRIAIEKVLTAEQRKKYREERRKKRKHRRRSHDK